MTLSQYEVMERCDILFKKGECSEDLMRGMQLTVIIYLQCLSTFGDISEELRKILTDYYLIKFERKIKSFV